MVNIFSTVFEMSVKASIVIILILLVRIALRNVPKKFSYILWSVAAFRLCVPASFKSFFSIFKFTKYNGNVSEAVKNVTDNISNNANDTLSQPITEISDAVVSQPADIIIQNSGAQNIGNIAEIGDNSQAISDMIMNDTAEISQTAPQIVDNTAETTAEAAQSIDWSAVIPQIIAAVWIIGLAAMLIYGIVSYVMLKRKLDTAILIRDNIYFSDRIDAPFSMGFIKPKIYLPFGLSEDEQNCIIAHEKCHIKRFDHIVKPFAYVLLAVHWFNPLCWIAFNRMGYDMEMSCDEMVFRNGWDEDMKKLYSRTLLTIGTQKRFPSPCPITFDGVSNTKRRIKHVLSMKKTKTWIKTICYVLCIVVLVACASDVIENVGEVISDKENISEETVIAAYNQFINGEIAAKDQDGNEKEWASYVVDFESDSLESGIDKYTFHDMNGDGISELVASGPITNAIFTYKDGNVNCVFENDAVMDDTFILENGALFSEKTMNGYYFYRYTKLNADGKAESITFNEPIDYSDNSFCYFDGMAVSRGNYNQLTEEYWSAADRKIDVEWIESINDSIIVANTNHFQVYKTTDMKSSVVWYYSDDTIVSNCYVDNYFDGYYVSDYNGDKKQQVWHFLNEANTSPFAMSLYGYEDYVFIDENENIINKMEYTKNEFVAIRDGKNALVSGNGEILAYLPEVVVDAYKQENGLIVATYYEDDLVRLLDEHGDALNETGFDKIGTFSDGLATVSLNGKIGLIDIYGNILIKPSLGKNNSAPDIYDGKIAFIQNDGGYDGNIGNLAFANVAAEIGKPDAMNYLTAVLNNNRKFVDESGEEFFIKDYDIGTETDVASSIFFDMDSDGTHELIIELTDYHGYIVLHYYDGRIYGYFMNYRAMQELKTDGSYMGSGGAAINSIYTMSFNGTQKIETEIARNWEEDYGSYQLDGKNVEKSEVEAFFDEWFDRESVDFGPDTSALKISIDYATDGMMENKDKYYVYFLDESGINSGWNIVFTVNKEISDFKFLELDEREELKIGSVLFESETLSPHKPFIASTYINDANANRGFSFKDENGIVRYFAVEYSGRDGSLSLVEVKLNGSSE